jgi:hypothetical protein
MHSAAFTPLLPEPLPVELGLLDEPQAAVATTHMMTGTVIKTLRRWLLGDLLMRA